MTDNTRDQLATRIVQNVNDLVRPFTDRQTISDTPKGATVSRRLRHASVIDQIRYGVKVAQDVGESKRPVPDSQPPPGVEPAEILSVIDGDIRLWLRVFGIKPNPTVEDNLRALAAVSLTTTPTDAELEQIAHDTAHYALTCRVYVGWDDRHAPRVARGVECYLCKTVGKILLIPADAAARCLACEAHWDRGNVHLIAEEIERGKLGIPAPRDAHEQHDTPMTG